LLDAVALYRREFRPSAQLKAPHVIAGLTVIAADTLREAEEQQVAVERSRVRLLLAQGRPLSDEEADLLRETPAGQQLKQVLTYAAVGTRDEVRAYAAEFAEHAQADELMVIHPTPTLDARLHSVELLGDTQETARACA
jgi:alkanesulfonate monooxygenase SsuD/methylene tetrahydromethanopterin reductase-like flavin-dependent oxidoreductase (luciferase family)